MTNDEGTLRQRRERINKLLKKQGIGLEKYSKRYLEQLKHTNLTAFNALADAKFIELVRSLLESNDGNGINEWKIRQEAAYEIGISMETAKNYLFKHSSRKAEFFLFGKNVLLNADYQPREDEGDEDPG